MAETPVEPAPVEDWGVTVDQVLAKLPHLDVDRVQAAGDDVFNGAATGVTRADIEQFIRETAGRVGARIDGWDAVSGGTLGAVVAMGAPSLVISGAAAMTAEAEWPGATRAAQLWEQYKEGLVALVAMVDERLGRDTQGDVSDKPAGSPQAFGSYVPTSIYVRW